MIHQMSLALTLKAGINTRTKLIGWPSSMNPTPRHDITSEARKLNRLTRDRDHLINDVIDISTNPMC